MDSAIQPDTRKALVMRSAGSSYTLRDCEDGCLREARLRGKLRLKGVRTTNPVSVGDFVFYEVLEQGEAVIVGIEQRRNYIIRRSPNLSKESHIIAANIDQAALVVSLISPATNTEFIDRFLVTCEAYGVPAFIVLNKIDLLDGYPDSVEPFFADYGKAGYEVIGVSASQRINLEALKDKMAGKTTLLSGNSGVGKSTLITELVPGAQAKTAEVSGYHHKGRHTTTFARMYGLSDGGFLIDTPGIKGFGLIEIGSEELFHFFPEMMSRAEKCQYYNCTHVHEPGCAVIKAVEEDEIPYSRYVSYLKILEEDEKYRK